MPTLAQDVHADWGTTLTVTNGISTVYNGHLRGPMTFTLVDERLAVELSLEQLELQHSTFRLQGKRSIPQLVRSDENNF